MQLFYGHINGIEFHLDAGEIQHCVKVLRKSVGDHIHFITGNGALYEGEISFMSKSKVYGSFTEVEREFGKVPYDLTVAIAPTKSMDRIEAFVEKAVEMGISRIIPIICEHSERRTIKTERLRKIALSATKQSLKGALVHIDESISFQEFLAQKQEQLMIAHCEYDETKKGIHEVLNPSRPLCIMIGPEGDFSPSEVLAAKSAGAKPIHLGSSRLRTETAGLVAVATVYHLLD
ncbi:MAG: 16S rRNA (uracil(1498)-N(3))-methyltransferase [Schleiferiaceae bacterium]|nr:16S rRNA (uracil(1498)-N(3))-methyltransferase [Schleiferiaceae bacterium]